MTKLGAPFVMVAFGWPMVAQVWSVALVATAVIFWFTTSDDPELVARRAKGIKAPGTLLQLEPLRNIQVWRFSLYYFSCSACVARPWLPHYPIGVYGLHQDRRRSPRRASIPASLFRVYGGHLFHRRSPARCT